MPIDGILAGEAVISGEVRTETRITGTIAPISSIIGKISKGESTNAATDDGNGNVETGINANEDGNGNISLFGITANDNGETVSIQVIHGNISGLISASQNVAGSVSSRRDITGALDIIGERGVEIYDGPVTVIPSNQEQTLSTRGFKLNSDITVAAIPSNYGLITWNGSTLTVS